MKVKQNLTLVARRRCATLLAAVLPILFLGFGLMAPATAADKDPAAAAPPATAPAPSAVTIQDPEIAVDDLDLMIEPMTKEETDREAKAWFGLVTAKGHEISAAELAVRRKNREIAQLAKMKDAANELAKAASEVKAKEESGGSATEQEKNAAAARFAEAQKALGQDVQAANQEAEKDAAKVVAAAPATPPPPAAHATTKTPAAHPAAKAPAAHPAQTAGAASTPTNTNDQDVMKRDVDGAGAAKKDASETDAVTSLAQMAPAGAGASSAAAVEASSQNVESLANKAAEATDAKTDVKVQLVDYSTQLTSQRTALLDRLKLVLDKLDLKGGDSKEYRAYVASLGGIKIDVSDSVATWQRIKSWLASEEGGLRWLREIGTFLGFVLGSIVLASFVRMIMRRMMVMAHGSSRLLQEFLVVNAGRAVILAGVLLGLSALEINLAPILAIIGAAGFVVAFALQGTLSNFASGLLLMVNKPFDVGDIVEVAGAKGRVDAVSVFNTVVQSEDGLKKIIPNNTIWNGTIVNYTQGTLVDHKTEAETKPADAKPADTA